ncbi:MAG: glycosyltransferase [Candidatus Marinimicrobia bacterium]|nr:glycosyltransferase [Candidatus Neomarinimicrobiota bacterium]
MAPHDVNTKNHEFIDDVEIYRFQYWFTKKGQRVAYGGGMLDNLAHAFLAKIQFPFFLLFFFLKGLKVGKKCDLFHAIWIPSGFVSIFIRKFFRKKFKIPIFLLVLGGGLRSTPNFFSKWVLKRMDVINSYQPELTELIKSLVPNKKLVSIPLIYETKKISLSDLSRLKYELDIENEKVVLYMARFVEIKDPLTFIKAIPSIIANYNDIKFIMVGDGPLMEKVKCEIKRLKIEDYIILTGFRNDRFIFYKLADVFVTISPIENIWSSTIIEVTLSGAPCILSKSGYTDKIFTDGFDAILVKTKNEKELANGILSLINDENKREYIAKNALKTISKYNFKKETIVSEHLEIFKKLINRQREKKIRGGL